MSDFIKHVPHSGCGSNDNGSLYSDGKAYCHKCNVQYKPEETEVTPTYNKPTLLTVDTVSTLPFAIQPKRRVSPEVYKYLNIRMSVNSATGQPDTIYYPGYIKGELSGYKVKKLPKDFKHPSVGSMTGVDWFGWNLIKGHKKIIIVEGEEDVAAVVHMLTARNKGTQWEGIMPNVVSPPMGIGSLASGLEKIHQELMQFQEVIFIPDNDKDKAKAITTISQFVEFSKLKILEVPTKDSSDMLQANKEEEWLSLYFKAPVYRPSSIINIRDTLDLVLDNKVTPCYDYPEAWKKFNYFTLGRRFGDFDILSAGTGNGKSFLIKEMILSDLQNTQFKTGVLALEENPRDTIVGLMSLHANKRLLDPAVAKETTDEEFKKHWEYISKDERIHVVNHEGTMLESEVLLNVTYLASCYGCKFIYVDNLGNIMPDKRSNDKLDDTNTFLERLRGLAIKLNVWICLVVHLRKNSLNTRSFESGAIATESDLYGSSGIAKKAFNIMFIQRNKHHSDEQMRNVARLHVLKCRFLGSGRTGPCDYLKFNNETGRLDWIPEPDKEIQEPLEQNGIDL